MNTRITLLAAAISTVVLGGCSDTETAVPIDGPGSGTGEPVPVTLRRLEVIDNSDEFYGELREALIQQHQGSRQGAGEIGILDADTAFPTAGGGEAAPAALESAGDSQSADSSVAPDVTGTNVQEVGVDEADRVKSDGRFLYVLESSFQFGIGIDGPAVEPVDQPIDLLLGAPEEVDGEPSTDEPILVDSVPGASSLSLPAPQESTTRLRILSLQPDAPDAMPIQELTLDMRGRQAQGMYLSDDGNSVLLTASGGNFWGYWGDPFGFAGQESIIAALDVSQPGQAGLRDSLRLDGQIISSRRIGDQLFVASRYYPEVNTVRPYDVSQEDWRAMIESADLSAVLPQFTRTSDGNTQPLVDPAGCFVAPRVSNDLYYSPDIISLSVIDINTLELTDNECFLGATETLYASPDAVYLATTRWDYRGVPEIDFDDVSSDIAYVDPRIDTDIHQFDIDGGQLRYNGTGVVPGHLGWNELRKPFRMSAQDGVLRVATYSDRQAADVSPVNVTILQPDGNGVLAELSRLPNERRPQHIGKPGEQLYASRFLGDKGYLVTFRQTDPLYVVDLSDPRDPFLAGELEITGFSEYLQPIGEDYLLGIGRDAVPAPDRFGDGRGGLVQGVKLSLFNVADATNPVEVQSLLVGQRGTFSRALDDHRAITVQRATDSRPTRIAFGIDVAGTPFPLSSPGPSEAGTYNRWNYTGLHGFEVHTGADARIENTGVLVAETASQSQYGPLQGEDRSVIVNDSVYYIHGRDVYAAPWFDLSNSIGPR